MFLVYVYLLMIASPFVIESANARMDTNTINHGTMVITKTISIRRGAGEKLSVDSGSGMSDPKCLLPFALFYRSCFTQQFNDCRIFC